MQSKHNDVLIARTHGYLGRSAVFDRIFTSVTHGALLYSRGQPANFEVMLAAKENEVLYLCTRCDLYPGILEMNDDTGNLLSTLNFYIGRMNQPPCVYGKPGDSLHVSLFEGGNLNGRAVIAEAKLTGAECSVERTALFLTDLTEFYMKHHPGFNTAIHGAPEQILNYVWSTYPYGSGKCYGMGSSPIIGNVDGKSMVSLINSFLMEIHNVSTSMGEQSYVNYLIKPLDEYKHIWRAFTVGKPKSTSETTLRYQHIFGMIGSMFEKVQMNFHTDYLIGYRDHHAAASTSLWGMTPVRTNVRCSVFEVLLVEIRLTSYRIPDKFRETYANVWKGMHQRSFMNMNGMESAQALQCVIAQMNDESFRLYLEYVIWEAVGVRLWYDVVKWLLGSVVKEKLSQRLARKRKAKNTSTRANKKQVL